VCPPSSANCDPLPTRNDISPRSSPPRRRRPLLDGEDRRCSTTTCSRSPGRPPTRVCPSSFPAHRLGGRRPTDLTSVAPFLTGAFSASCRGGATSPFAVPPRPWQTCGVGGRTSPRTNLLCARSDLRSAAEKRRPPQQCSFSLGLAHGPPRPTPWAAQILASNGILVLVASSPSGAGDSAGAGSSRPLKGLPRGAPVAWPPGAAFAHSNCVSTNDARAGPSRPSTTPKPYPPGLVFLLLACRPPPGFGRRGKNGVAPGIPSPFPLHGAWSVAPLVHQSRFVSGPLLPTSDDRPRRERGPREPRLYVSAFSSSPPANSPGTMHARPPFFFFFFFRPAARERSA